MERSERPGVREDSRPLFNGPVILLVISTLLVTFALGLWIGDVVSTQQLPTLPTKQIEQVKRITEVVKPVVTCKIIASRHDSWEDTELLQCSDGTLKVVKI